MSVNETLRKARETAESEPNVAKLRMCILELCNELANQSVHNLKLEATIHDLAKRAP